MEKISLKWSDFSAGVHKAFKNLRKEEDFFDVTLVGDDFKHVTAHKLVLSSSSEYFKKVFLNNKKYFQSHALISLEGLNQSDLNNILDYIYHGELQIYQQNLDKFLGIAKRLKLEGLIGADEQKVLDTDMVYPIKPEPKTTYSYLTPRVSLITEDLNVADITEDILEEKVSTLDNNCVSNSETQMTKGILEKEENVITFQSTEDLKDADKTENILEEKVLTLHNNCVSNSEKETTKDVLEKENYVITFQSTEDLKVAEDILEEKLLTLQNNCVSNSKQQMTKDGIEKEKNVITFQSLDVLSREELNQKADASYSLDVSAGLYACHHCSKTFRDKHHMNGHVDIHFDFSFPCTICDTILGSRNALRCHKKKKHPNTQNESIPEDFIITPKTKTPLLTESESQKAIEELDQKVEESYSKVSVGLYQCLHCSKTCKLRAHMKEHVETHFQGFLSFPCPMCDSVLKSRSTLKSHMKRQHNS